MSKRDNAERRLKLNPGTVYLLCCVPLHYKSNADK